MKWNPGGRSLIPRKRGEVVNERRSMPQRREAGRERSRIAEVGEGFDIGDFFFLFP